MSIDLTNIKNVYLVGIGGIGMSALARYFKYRGKQVAGYDKTFTPITSALTDLGILIHNEDAVANIPKSYLDIQNTLVIYTPAIPKHHKELSYFMSKGFEVMKRAEILGIITENIYTIAVAGTHGKTTTTAILAHLLKECGVKVTAFLGGISENFNSNLVLEGNDVVVVEADEFDRSFLKLYPDIAAITSMDADHLDIYGEATELEEAFKTFALKAKDTLICFEDLPIEGIRYGVKNEAVYQAQNIRIEQGWYIFDLKTPKTILKDLKLALPGKHNLCNAIAALSLALLYGVPKDQLVNALESFKGVQRRFSYHIQTESLVFIDDYAHHPTEINALHQAIREMHPHKNILAVFQPHLFSRTRDFMPEFAKSLSQFDQTILLDIYPARELPIPDVTSEKLLSMMDLKDKKLVKRETLISEIKQRDTEIIVTIGAGDIANEVQKIKEALS